MKKRKLNVRGITLMVIVTMFVAIGTGNLYKDYYKKQINSCMKAGNSYSYCERHLGR